MNVNNSRRSGDRISRRRFSQVLGLATIWVMVVIASWATADTRPNVVVIITDDQGYGDFSVNGNPIVQTTHIDRLARSSVRFDHFYVNSFCAPTRAALLTGRWPLRTGCHGVTHNREAMRTSEVTFAEALRSAGYRTACIGKWHNGEQYPYTAQGQGFDEFFGFNNGHWNQYFDATLLRGSKPETTSGYISDVLTDEALRFISRSKANPFLCYLAFNAPHSPYQVPNQNYEKFRQMGMAENLAAFYGMCENIDENVGRLLDHLQHEGLSDNTLVVFLTDNGGTAGVSTYNAGMRGGKTSMHEGGTRVPLFIRWPKAGWQSHSVSQLVAHIDIYPTLLDLCGVSSPSGPSIDGLSLRPLLENSSPTTWTERLLFTHNPINQTNKYPGAVRSDRYRLVREIPGKSGGSAANADDQAAGAWQLFDMLSDSSQARNIAADQPAIVAQLSAAYDAWFADVSQAGLRRFPLPVGHRQHNPVELHAPQAFFDSPLHFASGPGFANDWLTGWEDPKAQIRFEIEVATAGKYDCEIAYACPAKDAGSKLRCSVGEQALVALVPAAEAIEIPLPHRDEEGKSKYRNRQWATLKLGSLELPSGSHTLILEALTMPGEQVLELKHLQLTCLSFTNTD